MTGYQQQDKLSTIPGEANESESGLQERTIVADCGADISKIESTRNNNSYLDSKMQPE